MKTKKTNAFKWIVEPLEGIDGHMERPMFGCIATYVHGRLMAVLADREEPWNGFLVPTSKEHHGSLIRQFPALEAHPVLGKWLYVPASNESFEETATALVEAMASGDPRLGVEPKEKRKGKKSKDASR